MKLSQYITGMGIYTITGADPGVCLNRLTTEGIDLRQVERIDEFTLSFTADLKREKDILTMAEKAYCQGRCTAKYGLLRDIRKVLCRPLLILSVLWGMILPFFFGSLVWKIQIDVENPTVRYRIRHVLRDAGVEIWSETKNIDPQMLKYTLLQQIPELSWVAVNPRGGKITVLGCLRQSAPTDRASKEPCHLVSVAQGVITEATVSEGMSLVKVGDSVKKGQILVSAYEDYGLYLRAVCAQGEIYGQTWHSGTVITPSIRRIKQYTGRSWQETYILFGRKSINLSGSSSNLGVTCDKIIDTKQFCIPGYTFPLSLQRVTYREYTLTDLPFDRTDAQEQLHRAWEGSLLSSMVAGRVEETAYDCFEQGGYYIYNGESICHELLSRPMSPEPSKKGEDPLGTDH